MNIRKLTSQNNNDRFATVELDYGEIKCINNALTTLLSLQKKDPSISLDREIKAVKRNFVMLASLVKGGSLPAFECGLMHTIDEEISKKEAPDA